MVAFSNDISKNSETLMNTEQNIQDLANWFLTKDSMTHKKLQKLCYYAVAWGWALMNRPIVNDSEFQAWVHGPVSVTVYNKYRENGWNLLPKNQDIELSFSSDIEELLGSVWATYGDKDGNELEALSHIEKPWRSAREGISDSDISSNKIDESIMRDFYLSIFRGNDK